MGSPNDEDDDYESDDEDDEDEDDEEYQDSDMSEEEGEDVEVVNKRDKAGLPTPPQLHSPKYREEPPISFLYTGYSVNPNRRCAQHQRCKSFTESM
jgi:hypothetical protein